MTDFTATVWDRKIEPTPARHGQLPARSLTQYKRAIARDMEVLLNTRVALSSDELVAYPACADSSGNFGRAGFAQLCLTSSEDRKAVCDLVTNAIARHEPRLTHVRARLVEETGMVNRLSFAIYTGLRALASEEHVQFDVMPESSNLHYSIP